jgi:hypothetical protein
MFAMSPRFTPIAGAVVLCAGLTVLFLPAQPPQPVTPQRAKLILHDFKRVVPTPSFIALNRTRIQSLPIDGLAIYMAGQYLTPNISISVMTARPLDEAQVVSVLEPLRGLDLGPVSTQFALVFTDRPADFFDDWTVPIRNFAVLARALKQFGIRGVFFDNEQYFGKWGDYPTDCSYRNKTLREYQDQARLRGRQVMEAMVAEYPDIAVLSFHGPYLSEPAAPAPLFPQWQFANELMGPFFVGFVEGAGPASLVVDGGELFNLRSASDFEQTYLWRKYTIASDAVDSRFIPAELRPEWANRVSIAYYIYDMPWMGIPVNSSTFGTSLTHALKQADHFVWVYTEGRTFLLPPGQGGASGDWVYALQTARENAAPPQQTESAGGFKANKESTKAQPAK